ncbi:MAG: zinc-ribbon domain-containing protein [bacterium]
MTQRCPKCDAEIPKPVNVCTNCGHKLKDDRQQRKNPSRVEGCMSVIVFCSINAVAVWVFLKALL